eukprot:3256248-Amphidinium_carterae.1
MFGQLHGFSSRLASSLLVASCSICNDDVLREGYQFCWFDRHWIYSPDKNWLKWLYWLDSPATRALLSGQSGSTSPRTCRHDNGARFILEGNEVKRQRAKECDHQRVQLLESQAKMQGWRSD